MKLLEQVVSLELAKVLKKLEVTQDSLWVWIKIPYMDSGYECRLSWNIDQHLENYSAYTVAELGEILPGEIREILGKVPVDPYFLDCGKIDSKHSYYVRYIRHVIGDTIFITHGYNEADARAEMLIYLIKERVIKARDTKNEK